MKRSNRLSSALFVLFALMLLWACDMSVTPTPPPVIETPSGEPTEVGGLPSTPLPDVRPCLAADLNAVAGYHGVDGPMIGAVRFTHRGATSCALDGRPGVHLIDGDGNLMPVANLELNSEPLRDGQLVLRPGEAVYVSFVWGNWCGTAQGPYTLAVALPGEGGQLNVPALDPQGAPLSVTPPCEQAGTTSTISIGIFEEER